MTAFGNFFNEISRCLTRSRIKSGTFLCGKPSFNKKINIRKAIFPPIHQVPGLQVCHPFAADLDQTRLFL